MDRLDILQVFIIGLMLVALVLIFGSVLYFARIEREYGDVSGTEHPVPSAPARFADE